MPAIAIRHLSKTFEQKGNSVEALRDISLDIEEGRHLRNHWNVRCREKYPGAVSELSGEADER